MPLSPPHHSHTCDHPTCSKVSTKDCPKCHSTFYCTRGCQKAHYKTHKKDCNKLLNLHQAREASAREAHLTRQRAQAQQLRRESRSGSSGQDEEAQPGFVKELDTEEEEHAFLSGESSTKGAGTTAEGTDDELTEEDLAKLAEMDISVEVEEIDTPEGGRQKRIIIQRHDTEDGDDKTAAKSTAVSTTERAG